MKRVVTQEAEGFLRSIGTPEEALVLLLDSDRTATIDGPILISYLRASFAAGMSHTRDPYKWYSAEELIAMARASERAP